MAMGMWFVPLGSVLEAHGYGEFRGSMFATSGISAFISPLIFGAMADRKFAPVLVLRWLGLATALAMALATYAIGARLPWYWVLAACQLHSLCGAPTFSLTTTIVLSRLQDSKREFGPLRAMATVGWMAGCWIVSALGADQTTGAGYAGAVVWLAVVAFTYALSVVAPPRPSGLDGWRERLGLDALVLMKNRDHRVVFITAAIFNIPLCAFYPYTPQHLQALGIGATTAVMSLGQVTEVIAMFLMGALLAHWRLKWIFAAGIIAGVVRYALCALDTRAAVLIGVTIHGFAFTLFFITAQIYLDQRIDPSWRARSQALFQMMTAGVGNTAGYLGCGAWFLATKAGGQPQWQAFWGGLAVCVAVILGGFLMAYRGRGAARLRSGAGDGQEGA